MGPIQEPRGQPRPGCCVPVESEQWSSCMELSPAPVHPKSSLGYLRCQHNVNAMSIAACRKPAFVLGNFLEFFLSFFFLFIWLWLNLLIQNLWVETEGWLFCLLLGELKFFQAGRCLFLLSASSWDWTSSHWPRELARLLAVSLDGPYLEDEKTFVTRSKQTP